MGSFVTVNPSSGIEIKKYNYLSLESAQILVSEAHQDFLNWRKTSFAERSQVLNQLAVRLRAHKDHFAELMNLEMGKSLQEGMAEVEKCAFTCEYYAKEASSILSPQAAQTSYQSTEVIFEPVGVIFSIMPWNFPLWQVMRFAAPALMAGNTILLKHADITAGTAELLTSLFVDLHGTSLLLRNCHVDHSTAEVVIANFLIKGVTFTGSTAGGRAVAKIAAEHLKKIVLELGGSDAYLILEDADVKKAAQICAKARLQNSGQSCVAAKRFIVIEKIADKFIDEFMTELGQIALASLAAKRFQLGLAAQVEKIKDWGGRLVLGGLLPEGPGAYYPATVLVFDKNKNEIHDEEVFGPVAIVIKVQNEEEAISVANSSKFGLGAGVFTADLEKGKRLASQELEAGFVVVNDFVKSDPRVPFGGVKESGYGRELGKFGILEFVNIKTVGINS